VQGLYDHVADIQGQYMKLDDQEEDKPAAFTSSSSFASLPVGQSHDASDPDGTHEHSSDESMSLESDSEGAVSEDQGSSSENDEY